jgi:hypothetical protein
VSPWIHIRPVAFGGSYGMQVSTKGANFGDVLCQARQMLPPYTIPKQMSRCSMDQEISR